MKADIKGALMQIKKSYKFFEHRGKPMTKSQVIKVLKYGLEKGYCNTGEFTDEEVDAILNNNLKKDI